MAAYPHSGRAYRHNSFAKCYYKHFVILYNSYSKTLLLCWKGKPSSEDNSLLIIVHTDLLSSSRIKHHLNYQPKWKFWSTAPPRTGRCTPNLSEPKFNYIMYIVDKWMVRKLPQTRGRFRILVLSRSLSIIDLVDRRRLTLLVQTYGKSPNLLLCHICSTA